MSLSSITSYLPSCTNIFNKASRGTFKLGARALGCYIGSELARTQCLLYVPTLLNYYGSQIGSSQMIADFLPDWYKNHAPEFLTPWAAGRATLSISYESVETVSKAVGGALGATIGEYAANGALFVWDLTLMGFGFENELETSVTSSQRATSTSNASKSNVKYRIVSGRVVPD